MRVRYTRSIGLPVLDEETGDLLGELGGILINPDTGVIEGFFVGPLFLAGVDIIHWGLRVVVRSADVLGPLDERIRLQAIASGNRSVLGQAMVTESGKRLGTCRDVQFNTVDFRLEWLFPRRFWRWGVGVPASQIVEVRDDAIVLRDSTLTVRHEKEDDGELQLIPPMPDAA